MLHHFCQPLSAQHGRLSANRALTRRWNADVKNQLETALKACRQLEMVINLVVIIDWLNSAAVSTVFLRFKTSCR